jgi:hypothetical protein
MNNMLRQLGVSEKRLIHFNAAPTGAEIPPDAESLQPDNKEISERDAQAVIDGSGAPHAAAATHEAVQVLHGQRDTLEERLRLIHGEARGSKLGDARLDGHHSEPLVIHGNIIEMSPETVATRLRLELPRLFAEFRAVIDTSNRLATLDLSPKQRACLGELNSLESTLKFGERLIVPSNNGLDIDDKLGSSLAVIAESLGVPFSEADYQGNFLGRTVRDGRALLQSVDEMSDACQRIIARNRPLIEQKDSLNGRIHTAMQRIDRAFDRLPATSYNRLVLEDPALTKPSFNELLDYVDVRVKLNPGDTEANWRIHPFDELHNLTALARRAGSMVPTPPEAPEFFINYIEAIAKWCENFSEAERTRHEDEQFKAMHGRSKRTGWRARLFGE